MASEHSAGGATETGQLKPRRAADALAATLRRQIVEGKLDEGDRLMDEAGLEQAYGISRPTIRQALSMLEQEGLITVRHGSRGGATVRRPSIAVAARYAGYVLQSRGAVVGDVLATRMQLEPPVIRELAERCTSEDVRVLRDLIDSERSGTYDPVESPERFRLALAERSPSVTAAVIFGVLGEIAAQVTRLTTIRRSEADRQRFSTIGHQMRSDLVDLIERGDGAGAEVLWREYLQASQRILGTELLATPVDVLD